MTRDDETVGTGGAPAPAAREAAAPDPAPRARAPRAPAPPEAAPPEPANDVAALEAENERLRRRNAELEAPGAVKARRFGRSLAVVVLLIIGALCLTLSVPAIWARNQVLNTDRYVATMEPLATNADVQASVEAAVNRQISARLDIEAFVEQALPPEAQRLKAPLVSAVSGLISAAVHRAVTSEAFGTLWTAANRAAHTQLVGILTGEDEGKAITVSDGRVLLNLAPVIEAVKTRLVAAGLTVAQNIPAVGATIEIARLEGVDRAQQVVRWLDTVATWLPWIGLLFFVGAVALARGHRRRTVMWAALSTAIGLVVLRLALVVLREVYLDRMPTDVMTPQASAYVFDTVTRFLRDGIRLVFIIALVVAAIAILLGRRAALATVWTRVSDASRRGWDAVSTGPVGTGVGEHAAAAAGSVVAVGALVLVLWENPTGLVVLVTAIIVALLLAAVWGFAHQGAERQVGRPAA